MTAHNQKVLIISVSGIGNTILQSPLINALLNDQRYIIDVLFRDPIVQSIFQNDERIHAQFVLPKGSFNTFQFLSNLRRNHYDYSVTCFPSNRIWFHLLAFLIGAKKRVIHSYTIAKIRTLSFLSNIKISSSNDIHDVEQNLNLLEAFDLDPAKASKVLIFSTSPSNDEFANQFIKRNHLTDKKLVGIHPGSKYSERYKRWPQSNFVELINSLNTDGMNCLIFAGPDEIDYTKDIYNRLADQRKNILVIETKLNNIGSMIAQCHSFLSTDSGLGHIAIAKNIRTLAIIGPTNPIRIAPYGNKGEVISVNVKWSPCIGYPFTQTHSRIRCPYQFKCLNDLTVNMVYSKFKKMLSI